MPGDLPVTSSVTIPASELSWRFSRASGPGGQGVNTADSKAELRFDLAATAAIPEPLKARALTRLGPRLVDGVLIVTAAEHRSQLDNRRTALARLVAMLTEAMAPPARTRRPTRPSRTERLARLEQKRRRGALKQQRRTPTE
ncbi:MAG TPA: alternative ribosome rescue aminoacyl-tRNA hydrolase ArfB [Micromonosporaceae bacterium]